VERWTRFVLRHRWASLAVFVAVFLVSRLREHPPGLHVPRA
jgi:hypothetical protein